VSNRCEFVDWMNQIKRITTLASQVINRLTRTTTTNVNFSTGSIILKMVDKEELRKRLTPLQYQVTQEKGTERPFTGCYNKFYEPGMYVCICCEQPLFTSDTKYDSGCGWPAFNDVLDQGKVKLTPDLSGGRVRTEVTCSKCDAHLGHVFDDGPPPKRKRFCINSASINFIPAGTDGASGDTSNKS